MRIKVEWEDLPLDEPAWFDSEEGLKNYFMFLAGCPISDGPVRLRVTRYTAQPVEYLVVRDGYWVTEPPPNHVKRL